MRMICLAMLAAIVGASTAPAASQPTSSGPTKAAAKPTTSLSRGVTDAARTALRDAIVALGREYDQHLRDPGAALRANPTYFTDHPADEVTPDAIVQALLDRAGSDPRMAAYVKWQLLSGLPGEMQEDDPLAGQLLSAYRAAPPPVPRPGLSRQDQQKLDQLTQRARQADEPALIETIDRAVNRNRKDNSSILAYRDELYRRLPKGPETFAAALEDLHERLLAAVEGKALVKALVADVREWAATAAPSPQVLTTLARATRRLADTKGPQYYTTPSFSERSGVFAWRKSRAAVDSARTLKDLAVFLEEQSQQPAIDLTIKQKKS